MSDDTTIPEDRERLEQLALALLVHPGDPLAVHPRLYLGEIPENMPVEVPLPPQARVLGTLARSETAIEMVLECAGLTPDEALDFYRANLSASSWGEREDRGPLSRGGFVHRTSDFYTRVIFCHAASGAGLTIAVTPVEDNAARVRLNLSLDREMNPCAQPERRHDEPMGMRTQKIRQMIPALLPPVEARQWGGSGGGSSDEYYTTAMLQSTLELEPLGKHYADQLSQAGWTQTAADTSGPLTWHTWRFTGEEQDSWTALLFALAKPEKSGEYFLYIRVATDTPAGDGQSSGWTGYGFRSQRLWSSE